VHWSHVLHCRDILVTGQWAPSIEGGVSTARVRICVPTAHVVLQLDQTLQSDTTQSRRALRIVMTTSGTSTRPLLSSMNSGTVTLMCSDESGLNSGKAGKVIMAWVRPSCKLTTEEFDKRRRGFT
jgi:hypothetical protein